MAQEHCACPLTRGERILVAVDGTEFSDAAVDQAISLGGICHSEIFIIGVVDLYPEQMVVAPALVEKMSSEVREHLDRARNKVEKAGISCETIVRMGGKPRRPRRPSRSTVPPRWAIATGTASSSPAPAVSGHEWPARGRDRRRGTRSPR